MRFKAYITLFFVIISSLGCGLVYGQTQEPSEINSDYISASEFLSQLQINKDIDKAFDEEITRAEFVALVVRCVNMSGLSADENVFIDCVQSPFAREIVVAKELGITTGTSQNMFTPNGSVTYQVAAKMIVSALGGSVIAENNGGYPTGYIKLAGSLDIFSGIIQADSALTVGNAYVMIMNMLTSPVTLITGITGEDFIIETNYDECLLSRNFRLESVSGVVTTAGMYSIRDDYTQNNMLEIDGKTYKTHIFNPEKYLGYTVDAWYSKDENRVCAVYCGGENKTVEIKAEDVISYNNNKLEVFANNRNRSYSIERGFTYVVNGRATVHSSKNFAPENSTLTLIDNDSDGRFEFVNVAKKQYFVIKGINLDENTIYNAKSTPDSINLDNDDGHYCKLTVGSKDADIYSLTENMVCELYMSENGEVCVINAAENIVSGKVTALGEDEILINNKSYKPNTYFNSSLIALGESYTFLIAPDGTVTDVLKASDSMHYGYLLGFKTPGSSLEEPAVKLLTETNSYEVYPLASKINLDGNKISSDDSMLSQLFINGSVPNYQLIRYKLSGGKIIAVDTSKIATDNWNVDTAKDASDSLALNMDKTEVFYRSDSGFGIPNVAFSQAIVFHVPKKMLTESGKSYDDDMFAVNGTTGLINDTRYIVDVYDFDENYLPGAVVVYNSSDRGTLVTPTTMASPYMVREITNAVDDDGEALKLLKVYYNGKYEEFFIDQHAYENFVSGNKIPSEGDVVRLAFNSKGYVNGIATDVKYNKSNHTLTVNYGASGMGTSPWAYLVYFTGRAVSKTGNYLAIDAISVPEGSTNSENVMNLYMSSPEYVVYNVSTGEIQKGDNSSVITKAQGGTNGSSLIAARACYYKVNTVFVYVK